MTAITTIGFDADDTLWQNERFFRLTEERFKALLADYAEPGHLEERLLETEKRALSLYGFGMKSFILSMVETAIAVTEGRVPASVIAEILAAGRELAAYPIETLPHVEETLAALAGRYRLVMITKGDLFDQERKLAQSGLGEMFDAIEIVSDKQKHTYHRIFSHHGTGPDEAMMVGNSLRSDILPAIDAGAWGIYVPHDLTWSYEHAEAPDRAPRFRQIETIGELPELLAGLSRR